MRQKLDVGGVLSRAFQTYTSQAGVVLPAALVVFVAVGIISGFLFWLGTFGIGGGIGVLLGTLLAALVALAGLYLYQGMVVQVVRDVQDGRRDLSMGQLFKSAAPAILPLIGAGILIALAIQVPTWLVSLVSRPLGQLVGFVLGLFLATIWAVVAPVIVVERPGVIHALGRSRELVRGSGWQVFAVIVILYLILGIGVGLFVLILGAITSSFIGLGIGALIALILAAPIWALAVATMYFQLLQLKGEAGAAPVAAGAPARDALGTAPGGPTEAGAPSQVPPPGTAGTTPVRPTEPGPTQPPPSAAGGSTEPPLGPESPPRV